MTAKEFKKRQNVIFKNKKNNDELGIVLEKNRKENTLLIKTVKGNIKLNAEKALPINIQKTLDNF